MEFAWNTQKNKLSDVKGKELEQERQGKISNDEINLSETYKNYDLILSDLNLYQRVKKRIDDVREFSRIQRNSVVMYSNVITVNKKQYKQWGENKTKEYFKSVTEYFQKEFGEENVVSAKVHLDETTPHMHLHFVPVSNDNKLQARKVMTPARINKIHSEIPQFLKEKGFDVVRGKGATGRRNEKDIYKYKYEKLKETIKELEVKRDNMIMSLDIFDKLKISNINDNIDYIDEKYYLLNKNKVVLDKDAIDEFKKEYKSLLEAYNMLSNNNFILNLENKNLKSKVSKFEEERKQILKDRAFYLSKKNKLEEKEKSLFEKEDLLRDKLFKVEEDKKLYKYELDKKNKDKFETLERELDMYKTALQYKKEGYNSLKRKLELFIRNSKIDSELIDKYIEKYGNQLINDMQKNDNLNLNDDRIFIKFIYSSDKKVIKPNDIYKLKDAKRLINLLIGRYGQIEFEYELYRDYTRNIIHRDYLLLNKNTDLISEIYMQVSNSSSYFIRHKFNKDNEKVKSKIKFQKNNNYELEI